MNLQDYYSIVTDKLGDWLQAGVASLPNFVVGLLVIAVFAVIARVASSIARRVTSQATGSKALVGLVATCVRYAVLACGLFAALGIIGLQKTVFSLLAGAGVVGLAIGFAFQDLAANFISGIVIAFQQPFRIGDVIECGSFMGTVRKILLRNTLIETFAGQIVVVPNRQLFENPLINYSRSGARRIALEVGVAYDSDLDQVSKVAREAIESLEFLLEEKDVEVAAKEFGDSSINFTVYYWIKYPGGDVGYVPAIHRGVLAIKRAFDEAEINIPFPIRTLDFSLTGDHAANVNLTEPLREAS